MLLAAARRRFLGGGRASGLDAVADMTLEADPIATPWAAADADGRVALRGGLAVADGPPPRRRRVPAARRAGRTLVSAVDRWRLVLGRRSDRLGPRARRDATALDELYGAGRGEGAGAEVGGRGAGRGQGGFPTVREWSDELDSLFGTRVREEVLGRAAARGRSDVIEALDPESITPSVELLEQVLSLAGSLPEARLGPLRRMVRRVVDALVEELAIRRPAGAFGRRPATGDASPHRPAPSGAHRAGEPRDRPRDRCAGR